jgi:MFS transporter
LGLVSHPMKVSMTLTSDVTTTFVGTQTIRKLQIRILPYILLLYIISYLDRINIGFAALSMNQELGITSQQYGLLVGFFFISYSLFEIPSNLILHKVGARVWIARILIVWEIGRQRNATGANWAAMKFTRNPRTKFVSKRLSGRMDLVQLTVSECPQKNSKFQTPTPAESSNALRVRNRNERRHADFT